MSTIQQEQLLLPELIHHRTLFSPNGLTRAWSSQPHPSLRTPLLATASSDKSVQIWDLRDGKLLSTIRGGHKRSVRCVAWKDYGAATGTSTSGSGGLLTDANAPVMLATGSFDANAGLWMWNPSHSASSQRTETELTNRRTGNIDVDDGEIVEEDAYDAIEKAENGEEQADDEEWHFSTLLTGPDSEIKDLQFSPPHYSANILATCSRDKSVWVWEEVEDDEWETIAVLTEHTGDVKCVSWCRGAKYQPSRRGKTGAQNGQTKGEGDVAKNGEDPEQRIIGSREILASGSYDDTIRLWRDVEDEGDWMCVAVVEGHTGTVWDLKWEGYINRSLYALPSSSSTSTDGTTNGEENMFARDWEPRLLSCSDDLSIRLWRREFSESEIERKRSSFINPTTANPNPGPRLPSIIRPPNPLETWVEETQLPQVHVRSIYAIDWSERTGLVVSCGGDGAIAVYQEVVDDTSSLQPPSQSHPSNGEVTSVEGEAETAGTTPMEIDPPTELKKRQTKWIVLATIEAAHDEYEVNHVCWAVRRDTPDEQQQQEAEEMIVSTGDDGNVKFWRLPEEVRARLRS